MPALFNVPGPKLVAFDPEIVVVDPTGSVSVPVIEIVAIFVLKLFGTVTEPGPVRTPLSSARYGTVTLPLTVTFPPPYVEEPMWTVPAPGNERPVSKSNS